MIIIKNPLKNLTFLLHTRQKITIPIEHHYFITTPNLTDFRNNIYPTILLGYYSKKYYPTYETSNYIPNFSVI